MFGQQQNKPLFGTTGGAFGAATSAAPAFGAPATSSAFGAPAASTGGLFGAKPFGATTTTTGFGGGGFGQPQQPQGGENCRTYSVIFKALLSSVKCNE